MHKAADSLKAIAHELIEGDAAEFLMCAGDGLEFLSHHMSRHVADDPAVCSADLEGAARAVRAIAHGIKAHVNVMAYRADEALKECEETK